MTQPATPAKLETFDVLICGKHSGEIFAVVAATLETSQGRALLDGCEAQIVPAGKFKVGEKLAKTSGGDSVSGLPRR